MPSQPDPFFTIITPTILRPTLRRTCESINVQAFPSWEHLVVVDVENPQLPDYLCGPKRVIIECGKNHKAFGNYCRNRACQMAAGKFVGYLDDDDYYADINALSRVYEALIGGAKWAVGAAIIDRKLVPGYPAVGKIGSCQFFHPREGGYVWPAIPRYAADGEFCVFLRSRLGMPAKIEGPPIAIAPTHNHGRAT